MKPMNPPSVCPNDEDIKALIDGELPDVRRHHVERHLAECANCAALCRDLRLLTLEVQAMSEQVSCPESVAERVLSSLPERGPNRLRFFEFSFMRWTAAGGLVTVMGIMLVALLFPVFSKAREAARHRSTFGPPASSSSADYDEVAKIVAQSRAASPGAPPGGMGGAASAPMAEVAADAQFDLEGRSPMGRRNGDAYAGAGGRPVTPNVGVATDDVNKYTRGNAMDEVLRKVVKSAQVTVDVNERLETLQDRVSKKVTADEGYVESMDLTSPPSGKRTTRMALRVPVAQFESTIEYLSKLGEVTAKSLGGKDITGTWLDQRTDVRNLRTKEGRYAAAYRNARNKAERERARRQLLNLRPLLQSSEEQFAATAKLAALTRIDLTLVEEPQAKVRGDIGRDLQNTTKQASAAFMTALRIPATLLIWLAIFTPLWLPCLLAYRWATRMARRQQETVGIL